jgi:hypothetical protein
MFSSSTDGKVELPNEVELVIYSKFGFFTSDSAQIALVSRAARELMDKNYRLPYLRTRQHIEIMEIAKKNEHIAMLILQDTKLLNKLGRFDEKAVLVCDSPSYNLGYSPDAKNLPLIRGTYFTELAHIHASVKDYLKNNLETFRERLHPLLIKELEENKQTCNPR